MSDIAELGFTVNTSALKEGSTELKKLSAEAKATEDQAKRTGDALGKSADGVKKLGAESKTASDGVEQLAKSSGAAEAAAKRLGISVDDYNKKTQATKASITAANAATQAIAPAMTAATTASNAAAVASQAVARGTQAAASAAQATAPAMVAAATAARTMAVAKGEAVVTSANLAQALNTLRPAIVAAGGSMGTLPAAAAAARGGLLGVGLAAAGGAAVGLAKFADRIENTRGRMGALFGSTDAGRKVLDDLRASSERGGASLGTLANATEEVVRGLGRIEPKPGVYELGNQAQQAAQKVSAAFIEINRVFTGLHIPEGAFKPGLDALVRGLSDAKNQGKLTGDTFRQIQDASPEFARVLATAFNQTNVENFRRSLETVPRPIEQIANAMKQLDLSKVPGLDPSRPETFAEALDKVGRSWNRVLQSLTDSGAFSVIAAGIDKTSQAIDILSGKMNFWSKVGDLLDDYEKRTNAAAAATKKVQEAGSALSSSETASVLEALNKSLVGFADVGTDIQNAAQATGEFATQLPIAAEASTAFAGTTTEQMGAATTAIGETGQSAASFAQGFDGSMASAAASAEGSAQRIVSAMQSIIDAANAAAAAQANVGAGGGGGGGAIDTGVGSSPYAKGAAFAGGRVIPMAKGKVVTEPEFFPMADGAVGLRGEAGPEAVMPLGRTSGGDLGVKVAGSTSAGIPSDPVDAIETALKDQTQELRTAIGDSGDNLSTRFSRKLDEVIAAIERGNIKVSQVADSPAKTFDSAAGTFDTAVQQFGQSVQVATGGGQYTSSQSFAPAGATPGSPGGGAGLRTTVLLSSGSSGGSSGRSIAEALGFYDAWGGGRAMGGGDAMGGGGAFKPYNTPYGPVNNRQDASDRYWGSGRFSGPEASPGGYFGQYSDPTVIQPGARDNYGATTSSGYTGAGASSAPPNYDYGSDTAFTNSGYFGGSGGYSYDDGSYYGGYATGGSFTVGGSGGTDSQLVQFHATPGEMVSVSAPGQGGDGGGVMINMTVNATDAESFLKNKHALIGAIARELKQYDARR